MPVILVFIRFIRSIGRGLKDPAFRGLFFWVLVLLGSGTWFYHAYEGWSWLDSLYFTVITLTTVGYGDLSPQTPAGKIFTMIYIILGLGILSSFIVLVAQHQRTESPTFLNRFADRKQNKESENED